MAFNEHALEMSIMKLFENKGYIHISGNEITRDKSEVLLVDDLKAYLRKRYHGDGITDSEIESIILSLRAVSGTLYEVNKTVFRLIADGFIFNREDRTQKDIFIEFIDYDDIDNNIFKVVNQLEIEGYNYQIRIPDGIVYINGLPLVVLEFKTAIQENTTIIDAYTQLTVRYKRDIPEIFKYNAFLILAIFTMVVR
jgi:type I restriction enzyme R subunit